MTTVSVGAVCMVTFLTTCLLLTGGCSAADGQIGVRSHVAAHDLPVEADVIAVAQAQQRVAR